MERLDPAKPMEQVAEETLELVQIADEAGFEIAWAVEHHGHEHLIGPNPLMQLVHWANHTRRIRLGTAVLVVPYWHPLRLAGEIAMADLLTGGRLEIGIARGAFQYEFDRMLGGLPQEQGREYLFETVPAVVQLWAGDYAHTGQHWQFPKSTSIPKPVQQPHPPLWVAARDPASFSWAVQQGFNIMSTPHRLPMSEVESLAGKLDAALAANPGCRRPRWLVSRMSCVYEDPADWRIPVDAMRRTVEVFMALFNNATDVVNGFPQPVHLDEQDARGDYRPEALRQNMMFGTPDEIVAKLRQYEALGVNIFNYNANFGLPHEVAVRSLRLFAREVMPHFREPAERNGAAVKPVAKVATVR
jgi:alkanesulfonate monooxygenase SsuD/methylene tetrahydromethanopterin reductase-like flavin-dependent oxidoreductase (luciferase family)